MQGGRNPFFGFGDPFGSGGFGGQRDLISSFFGGRDPFDDPFFTRPFGGMFESSLFGPSRGPFMHAQPSGLFSPGGGPSMDAQPSGFLEHQSSQPARSRGLIIEELNSDDEKDEKDEKDKKEDTKKKKDNPRKHGRSIKEALIEDPDDDAEERRTKQMKKDNPRKHGRSIKEPLIEDPDDEAEERRTKQMQFRNDYHRGSLAQSFPRAQSFTFQSSTVTYGGANGAYYSSSSTRRAGSDGLTFEESKEANSATRQATHRISKGIHHKGHSVTRKLNSDGRVDTMQTLHNLEEDQLTGFEETWRGKARKHLPGWSEGLNTQEVIGSGSSSLNGPNRGGWALPDIGRSNQPENGVRPEMGHAAGPSGPHHAGRGRADAGGMSGSSSSKSRAPDTGSLDQSRKH